MKSYQTLVWILLPISRISAHTIPDQKTAGKEAEINIGPNQRLLSKAEILTLDLSKLSASERLNEDSHGAEYNNDSSLPSQTVNLVKRQVDTASSNTTITVSTKTTVTSSTALVTSFTTSSTISIAPSSSSSTKLVEGPTSITTIAMASSSVSSVSVNSIVFLPTTTVFTTLFTSFTTTLVESSTSITSEQSPTSFSIPVSPPTTSMVVIPPSGSTTVQSVTTSQPVTSNSPTVLPPSTDSIISQSATTVATPAPSPGPVTSISSQSPQSSQVPQDSQPAQSSQSSLSSESTQSSQTSNAGAGSPTQVPESPVQPGLVLVTSTLSNGETVTLTSYVGASAPSSAIAQGGTTTSPSGSLQSPSTGTGIRPLKVGAVLPALVLLLAI